MCLFNFLPRTTGVFTRKRVIPARARRRSFLSLRLRLCFPVPVHEDVRAPTQIPERRTWHNMRSYFSLLHRSVFQQQRFSDAIFTPTGSVFSSIATLDDCFHFPRGVVFYSNTEGKKQTRSQYRTLARKGRWQETHPDQIPRSVEPTICLELAMDSRSTIRAPYKHRLLESRQTLNEGRLRY